MDGDLNHQFSAEYTAHLVMAPKGCSTVCDICVWFRVLVVMFCYIILFHFLSASYINKVFCFFNLILCCFSFCKWYMKIVIMILITFFMF